VAAIEFLGPIVVAAAGMRTRRNQLALALVVCGVYLVTGVRLHGQAAGFAFAFANAALFALYVVLGHRVARAGANIDALAAAMLVAALVITPIGLLAAVPALTVPASIAAGIGVGVTSSVIPYVCDQLAMARLGRSAYALMVSLLPATAVVVGIVVLGQVPTLAAVAGVALVMAGVAGHRDRDQLA
jgi:inner membrane transporter RhtA